MPTPERSEVEKIVMCYSHKLSKKEAETLVFDITTALAQTVERCAGAICPWCKRNIPFEDAKETVHVEFLSSEVPSFIECKSVAFRAEVGGGK